MCGFSSHHAHGSRKSPKNYRARSTTDPTRARRASVKEGTTLLALTYGHANFWMRLLPASATKTFPLPSTATPSGTLNCPSPLPALPHLVRKVPVVSNFWTRLLLESATKTFPLPSTATPTGAENCPSPLPALPHLVTKVPVFENSWMRLLTVSATKT